MNNVEKVDVYRIRMFQSAVQGLFQFELILAGVIVEKPLFIYSMELQQPQKRTDFVSNK